MNGRRVSTAALAALFVLLTSQAAYATTTYSITVETNAPTYTAAASTVVVQGVVSASNASAIGPNTGVTVTVTNPNGTVVIVMLASVNGSNGKYQLDFVTGGTSSWIDGTYSVTATWGAHPPTVSNSTSFTYLPVATTTTSSTTSSTSSTNSTTTTSSTTSSSSNSTSTTSSSSTSSSSSSTTTSSSSSTKTSSGIPEFPAEPLLMLLVSAALVAAYVVARKRSGLSPYSRRPSSGMP